MKAAVLLVMVSAGLAFLVAGQLSGTRQAVKLGSSASSTPSASEGATLPEITYAQKRKYDHINDDNLFAPERRPVPGDIDAGPAPRAIPAAGKPGFELKGIVITPTGRYALLKVRRESDYRKVERGESVDGWVIDSIEPDSVLVKKQGTSTVIELKAPKSSLSRSAPRSRSNKSPTRQRK